MEEAIFKDDRTKEAWFAIFAVILAMFFVGFVFYLLGSIISANFLVRLLFLLSGGSLVLIFFFKKVKLEYHLIYQDFIVIKQLLNFASLPSKKVSFDKINRIGLSKVWGGGRKSNYGYFIVLFLKDNSYIFLKYSKERLTFFKELSDVYDFKVSEVWRTPARHQ